MSSGEGRLQEQDWDARLMPPGMDEKDVDGQGDAPLQEKAHAIQDACKRRNIDELKSLALSEGGFLSDDLRRLACKLIA